MSKEITTTNYNDSLFESDMNIAKAMYDSGIFPDMQNAQQAFVKLMFGRTIGLQPIESITGISFIKGKVILGADLHASKVKGSGKYDYRIREHTDTVCKIEFLTVGGDSLGISEFSMKQANEIGLTRNPVWKQYPKNMLFARAMSNGVKWFCPDVFGNATVYAEGESVALSELDKPARKKTENNETYEIQESLVHATDEPVTEYQALTAENAKDLLSDEAKALFKFKKTGMDEITKAWSKAIKQAEGDVQAANDLIIKELKGE